MKRLAIGVFLAIAVCLAGPLSADARGGHGGVRAGGGWHGGVHAGGGWHGGRAWGHRGFGDRFFFGGTVGWGWPWYPYSSWYPYGYYAPYGYSWPYGPYGYGYGYGYYGTWPPVVVQQQPLYDQPEQEQPYYWYYCRNSKTYYPYVKTCPGGWTKVAPPQTPDQSSEEGKPK